MKHYNLRTGKITERYAPYRMFGGRHKCNRCHVEFSLGCWSEMDSHAKWHDEQERRSVYEEIEKQ